MGRKVHQILPFFKKSLPVHTVTFGDFFFFFSCYHSYQVKPEITISLKDKQDSIQVILGKIMKIILFKIV